MRYKASISAVFEAESRDAAMQVWKSFIGSLPKPFGWLPRPMQDALPGVIGADIEVREVHEELKIERTPCQRK